MSAKGYFAEVLCIVYSEIAYYRYMFPESYFETVYLTSVVSHRLIKGKSAESDQILKYIEGISDAESKGLLKSLAIGLSINPLKPTFIRELYAFQFVDTSSSSDGKRTKKLTKKQISADEATTELLILDDSAPADYTPLAFLRFPSKEISGYMILPHCGSTRVGQAVRGGMSMYMCVLCVEGAVQIPALGTSVCPSPMLLDVDEDVHGTVFVATPAWLPSQEQITRSQGQYKSHHHPPVLSLLSGSDVETKRQSALVRRMVHMLRETPHGTVASLANSIGASKTKSRDTVLIGEILELMRINKNDRPHTYTATLQANPSVLEKLFSDDARVLLDVIMDPFRAVVTRTHGGSKSS
ncbi:hypothetical protein GGI07_004902 [Coemansia sp. Benny D115]|nr:hypothetical protein GGI07_004902 [Coemansia sp. Benny D115]